MKVCVAVAFSSTELNASVEAEIFSAVPVPLSDAVRVGWSLSLVLTVNNAFLPFRALAAVGAKETPILQLECAAMLVGQPVATTKSLAATPDNVGLPAIVIGAVPLLNSVSICVEAVLFKTVVRKRRPVGERLPRGASVGASVIVDVHAEFKIPLETT